MPKELPKERFKAKMSPKYRGDSEDWLDSDSDSSGQDGRGRAAPQKKKPKARSAQLPLAEANATVVEVFPNQCRVQRDVDGVELLCSYRRAEVIGKSVLLNARKQNATVAKERSPVAVGDRVQVVSEGGVGESRGVIEGICSRRNCLARSSPGRQFSRHVLAANIDLVVIVVSAREPLFSPGLVDRFLIAAQAEKIPTLICLSKMDLVDSGDSRERGWEIYSQLGFLLCEVSSKNRVGMDSLVPSIFGKTVVFCGQSGVGKTSLLRVLLQNDQLGRVSEVNLQTGKGRHTTTSAVLLGGPGSSRWIDTPGVREFSLEGISPEGLADYFPEMRDLSCSQKGCLHLEELECQAKELPRYFSYCRILDSILNEHPPD